MKTLILALGNPILSDDGVAHEVADRLAKRLASSCLVSDAFCERNNTQSCPERIQREAVRNTQYDIIKSSAATMDIIPKLAGYERLIVIDAVQLGSAPLGTVHHFTLSDLASTVRPSSPHDINFATAFQMAGKWGYHIPADIRIYGIEAKELSKFSQGCTPQITQKLDEIVEHILSDLVEN